jgi:hypothetical protein
MSPLAKLVLAGPAGQAPDLGGAGVKTLADLNHADLGATVRTRWSDGIAT